MLDENEANFVTFLDNLTTQERQLIIGNNATKMNFFNYLVNQNWSNESKQFVNELIYDMINFPNPEGEDNGDEFNFNDYSDIQTTTQILPGRNSFLFVFPKSWNKWHASPTGLSTYRG